MLQHISSEDDYLVVMLTSRINLSFKLFFGNFILIKMMKQIAVINTMIVKRILLVTFRLL